MIFKTASKKLLIKGEPAQSVQVSDELDLELFYADLQAHGYTINKPLFEASLLALDENSQANCEHVLVPGIYKEGAIVSFSSTTRTFVEHAFSRPSSARYLDDKGHFVTAAPDIPRIGFDVLSRKCLGYQFEKGSVNLLPHSHGHLGYSQGFETELAEGSQGYKILVKRAGSNGFNAHVGMLQVGKSYAYSAYIKIGEGVKPTHDAIKVLLGCVLNDYTIRFIAQGIYRIEAFLNCTVVPEYNWVGIETGDSIFAKEVRILGEQLEYGDQVSSYIETNGTVEARMADHIIFNADAPAAAGLFGTIQAPSFYLNQLVIFKNNLSENYITLR